MSTNATDSIKIHPYLLNLACWFWPDLRNRSKERQVIGTGEVVSAIYTFPFMLAGIIWLALVTDLRWLREDWLVFLILTALVVIFNVPH